MWSRNLMLSTI